MHDSNLFEQQSQFSHIPRWLGEYATGYENNIYPDQRYSGAPHLSNISVIDWPFTSALGYPDASYLMFSPVQNETNDAVRNQFFLLVDQPLHAFTPTTYPGQTQAQQFYHEEAGPWDHTTLLRHPWSTSSSIVSFMALWSQWNPTTQLVDMKYGNYYDFLEAHGNDCFVEAYSDPHVGSGLHAFECHAEYLNPDSQLGLSEGQWVVEAGFEDHPVSLVTIGGAQLACEHWGGHLCKLEEWQHACHGPQGLPFPYGNEYDPLACNACEHPTGGLCGDWPGEPVAVGSYAGCEGGYPGLFDMSGNVYEWVDHCLWIENEYSEFLVCVQKGGGIAGVIEDLDCGDDGPDDYWWDRPYNWSEIGGFRCCYYQD